MHVGFAVFKFFRRVYKSEFILFDTAEEEISIVGNVMLFKR